MNDKYQTADPRTPNQVGKDVIISPDTERASRIPPGQSRTQKWPVLQAGLVPSIPKDQWQLHIYGLVQKRTEYGWNTFRKLPQVKVYSDFHCVTKWSRLDNVWQGVSTQELLNHSGIQPTARFVILHGYDDGWTTNLPIDEFLANDALLAHSHDGRPLDDEHGGPVRAVVPCLYAWKSAKWICGIELVSQDSPGYWERAGYHDLGNPWKEQRFRSPTP